MADSDGWRGADDSQERQALVIPLSDNPGPRRRFPFVNYALILINIAAFVAEVVYGQCFQFAYACSLPGWFPA